MYRGTTFQIDTELVALRVCQVTSGVFCSYPVKHHRNSRRVRAGKVITDDVRASTRQCPVREHTH